MSNDFLNSLSLRFGDEIVLVDEQGITYEGDFRGAYNPNNGTFIFYNNDTRRKEMVFLSKIKKIEKAI